MHRLNPDDEFAETQTLNGDKGVVPVTHISSRRNGQQPPKRTEAEADALYREYLKACEEAGLTPNPPYRKR